MTDHSGFSAIESIKLAWEKVKGTKKTFWLILLIIFILQLINSAINGFISTKPSFVFIYSLIGLVVSITGTIFTWGLIYLGIQRAKGESIKASMVKYVFDFWIFLKMIGATILQFFIALPAFILFFVAFLIQAKMGTGGGVSVLSIILDLIAFIYFVFIFVRLFLVPCLIIAEKQNPWKAIKTSFKATKSHFWQLLGLFIINWFICIISILLLCIGLIWSLPYLFINFGVVYKKLTENISLQ